VGLLLLASTPLLRPVPSRTEVDSCSAERGTCVSEVDVMIAPPDSARARTARSREVPVGVEPATKTSREGDRRRSARSACSPLALRFVRAGI